MKNQTIKISAIIILLAPFLSASAQFSKLEDSLSTSKKSSLHIGDKVPNRYFTADNYKDKEINLTNFKGKWIMLDLWGVYCASCIEHMPDAENLQNKFKDSLQVILVSKNTTLQVQKVAKIAENVRKSKLPFVNGKDQISGLFDFSYVPLYIWINPYGIITYITYERFSEDIVKNILAGKQYDFAEKKTIVFAKHEVPIMVNLYPLLGDNFYIYSYLAAHDTSKYDYSAGRGTSLGFSGLPKFESGRYNLKSLYKAAYSFYIPNNPMPDERVIANFSDSARYSNPSLTYDYEIIVHKNISEARVRKYMQNQFDLFFNVSSHIEKRMVPCLVFKTLKNGHNCFSKDSETNQLDEYGQKKMRVTLAWGKFFEYINFSGMTPPHTVIDETGIDLKEIVKIDMSIDFENLKNVVKSLELYGLTIVKENRLEDCIIIGDVL